MHRLPAEPLLFDPIYKEKIWGGRALESKLGKVLPPDKLIGESWEISGYGPDQTVVAAGELQGKTLGELFLSFPQELTGAAEPGPVFPLLYKFLDANDRLSVQVHPDDAQARQYGWGGYGKTECWYVVDCKEDARIIVGFKDEVLRDDVRRAVETNTLEELLNFIRIGPGDCLFIPAGTVHAILDGTLIYEVQETSDTTLRLYDWGRLDDQGRPRDLHVKDALQVLDTRHHNRHRIEPVVLDQSGYKHAYRVACRYFAIEQYAFLRDIDLELPRKSSYQTIAVIGGQLKIVVGNKVMIAPLGRSVLLPATLMSVRVSGSGGTRFLVSSVPDLKSEIVDPLLHLGVPPETIELLGGQPGRNDLAPLLV